ncbi:helix-turn-helix domain-containing protein [Pontibacter pamirensis]|uniref:helix-turn-helix domain-containing protein n=1 Tax=Pontibacter pamirensis TaxID=2562824 RepID=UPI0021D2DF8B|nr:helix-turn-helix domain-containing protein [Pontibacter pamirensis]
MRFSESQGKRGQQGGRPTGLSKAAVEKAKSARILFDSGTYTVEETAKILGIGRTTCYCYIQSASLS